MSLVTREEAMQRLTTERDNFMSLVGSLDDSLTRALISLHFKSPGEPFRPPVDRLRRDNERYRSHTMEMLRRDYCKFNEHNALVQLSDKFKKLNTQRSTVCRLLCDCVAFTEKYGDYMSEAEREDVRQRLDVFSRQLCTVMSQCDFLAARYADTADLFSALSMPDEYFQDVILNSFSSPPSAFDESLAESAQVLDQLVERRKTRNLLAYEVAQAFIKINNPLCASHGIILPGRIVDWYNDTLQRWESLYEEVNSQQVVQADLIERLKNIFGSAKKMPASVRDHRGTTISVSELRSAYQSYRNVSAGLVRLAELSTDLEGSMQSLMQEVISPVRCRLVSTGVQLG